MPLLHAASAVSLRSSCQTPACTPPIRCSCAACQDGGATSCARLVCDMCSCTCVYQKQDARPVPCPTHEICIPDSEFSAITKMIEYSGADLEQVVDKGTTLLIAAAELDIAQFQTSSSSRPEFRCHGLAVQNCCSLGWSCIPGSVTPFLANLASFAAGYLLLSI